jgi:3-oxoacyl-[acyl-carrier protein] reductase
MELSLIGKRAVVIGASRGLGRSIATALAGEGSYVLGVARDVNELAIYAAETGQATLSADLSSEAGGDKLREAVMAEGLDILICNAGSGRSVPPGEETAAEWRRMLDVNLFPAVHAIKAVRDLIRPGGAIVCVSSITGRRALGAPAAYSAAKAALDSLIANLAGPLAKGGVRIVGVAPGNLLFPGSVWERKQRQDPSAIEDMLAREVPLGRFGTLEEIASVVVFLASDRASFMTGTVVVADGGQSGTT